MKSGILTRSSNRWLPPLLLAAASFLVYAMTSAPDVMFTDSGELAAVCSTLGVAHPPGYPLFTILGRVWVAAIPLLEPIRALNLFAAFLTALSVGLFYWVASMLLQMLAYPTVASEGAGDQGATYARSVETRRRMVAATGALVYGFCTVVWAQGTSIEVYALQLVLVLVTLALFLRTILAGSDSFWSHLPWAYSLGLAFANHYSGVMIVPALVVLYFRRPGERAEFSPKRLVTGAALLVPFLAALSIYAYLPIRSAAQPIMDWGATSSSITSLLNHVSLEMYGELIEEGEVNAREQVDRLVELAGIPLALIMAVPFVWGAIELFRRQRELLWFIAIMGLTSVLVAINYGIADIDAYFSVAFIAMILTITAGMWIVVERSPQTLPLLMILPIATFGLNISEADKSGQYQVSEYTRLMIDNVDPHALLLTTQWIYLASAFMYKQAVEGVRPDVALVDIHLLWRSWYLDQMSRWYPGLFDGCRPELERFRRVILARERGSEPSSQLLEGTYQSLLAAMIESNRAKRPVYVTLDVETKYPSLIGRYSSLQQGMAFRLETEAKEIPVRMELFDIQKFSSYVPSSDKLEHRIRMAVGLYLRRLGSYARSTGQHEQAREAYRRALHLDPADAEARDGLRRVSKAAN